METSFVRRTPCLDRVYFTLTVDRKRMKERILIGRSEDIRTSLMGSKDADVMEDVTRPLGTMLVDFEHDQKGDWNRLGIAPLNEAMQSTRWKQPALEQAASEFLKSKFDSRDPVCQYAAYRIWNGYLTARLVRDRNRARIDYMHDVCGLAECFGSEPPLQFNEETGQPKPYELSYLHDAPERATKLELWYPDRIRTQECTVIYSSFYPLLTYYLNRLNEWGLHVRRCKICGRIFCAKNQKYELCSDKCRKKQAQQNKREFDERARENNYDLLYKNECQRWRNKINKAKKTAGFPLERLEEMRIAFEVFKKEAVQRKGLVKTKQASPKEFSDWLFQQGHTISELLEVGMNNGDL